MSSAATWMYLESVILSEESQRKKNIILYWLYAESSKATNELNLPNRKRVTDEENKLMVTEWNKGRDKLELGLTHTYCYIQNR